MTTRYVPGLLLLALSLAPCRGAVLYVNQHAPGPAADGLTWATAFRTVQQAVDAAGPGDELWVAAGMYRENLWVTSGKSLYGGFDGTETERSQRNWTRNITILDGGFAGSVVAITTGSDSSAMVTVDGFTVQSGVAPGSGGGFRISCDATIANNRIVGNTAISNGLGTGGGIRALLGTVTVMNDLIIGNVADKGSAIAHGSRGQVTVVNSTVVGNRAVSGGAILTGSFGSVAVVNSLIAGNDSGILREAGTVTLSHSDVYGNTEYNFQGLPDPTGTDGNLSVDPKLSSVATGLHLQPGSPCLDAGDDSVVEAGETDLYGKPRVIGGHVDIGADESDGTAYPAPTPRVWYLSAAGDDANDGSSWQKAKATLRMALLYAEPGDEVWVAKGTYTGVCTLKRDVGLYGGFAGTETDRSQRNPVENPTALDGVIFKGTYTSYAGTVLTIPADATPATVVDGFIIQHGEASTGGGMLIRGGSPTVTNNLFTDNGILALAASSSPRTHGGGLYVAAGSPLIAHNTFSRNWAYNGGGLYSNDGTAVITDNVFTDNTLVYAGGGLCVVGGTPLIANNTIAGNNARYAAGLYASSGLIRDNLITENVTNSYYRDSAGAGLFVGDMAVAVHNRIIANTDDGGAGGGGAYVEGILLDNLLRDNFAWPGAALYVAGNSRVRRNTILSSGDTRWSTHVTSRGGAFTDNLLATQSGSAMELHYSAVPAVIANNTLVNTGPPVVGTVSNVAIYAAYMSGEHPDLVNNIFVGWAKVGAIVDTGGTPAVFNVSHNDCWGNTDNSIPFPGSQTGNISADPLFLDPANGDYRLQAGSPCIDAGDAGLVSEGDQDLSGGPRIVGSHVDIGAYEYGSQAWTMLDAAEVLRVAAGLSLASPAEVSRLDVAAEDADGGRLSMVDAARIARWLLE